MGMLPLFLRQRYLSIRNSFTRRSALRRLPFIAIGIGFWLLLYLGSRGTLLFVRTLGPFGDALAERLLAMIFFSLTGFLALSNIITGLSSFYLSREIPFLLSKPLLTRDIIRLKTLETILNSSWMVLSFVPPVFIAYGEVYGATAVYYCSVPAALVLLILLTAGLGISLAHLLARLFPARRSRDFLFGLGLMLFLAAYFVMKSSIPSGSAGLEDIVSSFMRFSTDSPLLPGTWVLLAVLPTLKQKSPDLFYAAVLVSNSLFLLLLSSLIGTGLYMQNIGRLQPAGRAGGQGFLSRLYLQGRYALLYKDLRIFVRDTGQWSQLFIILALVLVYVYNFRTVPLAAFSGAPFLKEILVLVNLALAGLVLSAVSARFVFTSVSLEGQAFWVVRSAPVDLGRFLWSKFFQGCAPVAVLVCLLVFLTNTALAVTGRLMYLSLAIVLLLCVSVSGLGAGLGALFPRFTYENIASVSMGIGGMTFMILAFSLVLLTLSGVSWVFYAITVNGGQMTAAGKIGVAAVTCAVILANAAAFYIPMRRGARALEAMEL